jgi:hypothetical protein
VKKGGVMLKEMTKEEAKYVQKFNMESLLEGLEPRLKKLVKPRVRKALQKAYDLGREHEKPGYPHIHAIMDDHKEEFKRFFGVEMEKFNGVFQI